MIYLVLCINNTFMVCIFFYVLWKVKSSAQLAVPNENSENLKKSDVKIMRTIQGCSWLFILISLQDFDWEVHLIHVCTHVSIWCTIKKQFLVLTSNSSDIPACRRRLGFESSMHSHCKWPVCCVCVSLRRPFSPPLWRWGYRVCV